MIFLNNLIEKERARLIELLSKEEEKPKKGKGWKPKEGEYFYCLACTGEIAADKWKETAADKAIYAIGNCFPTYKAAAFAYEKQKVIAELKRFAEEFNDGEADFCGWRHNCIFYFDYETKEIKYLKGTTAKITEITFTSETVAKRAVLAIGEERLKKYYFEVKENDEKNR